MKAEEITEGCVFRQDGEVHYRVLEVQDNGDGTISALVRYTQDGGTGVRLFDVGSTVFLTKD